MKSIIEIEKYIDDLDVKTRKIVKNIYDIQSFETKLVIPDLFQEKVLQYFSKKDENGNILETFEEVEKRVTKQRVVKIFNKFTYEGALFNYLRALRPGSQVKGIIEQKRHIEKDIGETTNHCDFCNPESYTPEDTFGRVRGIHCITSANLTKYDLYHSLVIFKRHNPLDFNREELFDYIDTSFDWFKIVKARNPSFTYPLLIWNCLPKAGASRVHGHIQLLMCDRLYPKQSIYNSACINYENIYNKNFFDDLLCVHEALGLLRRKGSISIIFYLTPIKEREILIFGTSVDIDFKETVYKVLRYYIDELGVFSFNLSLSLIPDSKGKSSYILRLVDRGNPLNKTSDIASMELYASSVISNDPFNIIAKLKNI